MGNSTSSPPSPALLPPPPKLPALASLAYLQNDPNAFLNTNPPSTRPLQPTQINLTITYKDHVEKIP